MDGFELCSELHKSGKNKATPVVFVTQHSDFDTRAKSTKVSKQELIAKPFLVFEIAVKALTLVLVARHRIHEEKEQTKKKIAARKALNRPVEGPARTQIFVRKELEAAAAPVTKPPAQTDSLHIERKTEQPARKVETKVPAKPSEVSVPATRTASTEDIRKAFFDHAPSQIKDLSEKWKAVKPDTSSAMCPDALGRFYASLHSLIAEAERGSWERY